MRPRPRGGRLGGPCPRQLPIDQADDGPDPRGVAAAVVASGLGQGVVTAQPPNGVLDGDPAAGEGACVRQLKNRF